MLLYVFNQTKSFDRFHGCENSEMERLLESATYFRKSRNDYDWLGHGMYFWENSHDRAIEWAIQKKVAGSLKVPTAVGAVIDLGFCLDLLDSNNLTILKKNFQKFIKESKDAIPENQKHRFEKGNDNVLRYRDCAVIEYLHSFYKIENLRQYDSVRAAFIEGDPIYPGAGFHEKTHIQICVRNPNCLKGFFIPRKKRNHICRFDIYFGN